MNCEQFEQLLDQYLDNELQGTIKLEFEAHMVDCEGCGHLFAMSEAIGQIIAEPDFEEPVLPDDFSTRVLDEIERRKHIKRTLYKIIAPAGLVASVAIILMSVIIFSAASTDSTNKVMPVKLTASKTNISKIIPMISSTDTTIPDKAEFASAKISVKSINSERSDVEPIEQLSAKSNIVSSVTVKPQQVENRELEDELNTWLAQTLERAGLTVWELAQLKTLAWDKMREGLIDSLKTPSLLPAGALVPITPIMNNAVNNSGDVGSPSGDEDVSVEQGLELI